MNIEPDKSKLPLDLKKMQNLEADFDFHLLERVAADYSRHQVAHQLLAYQNTLSGNDDPEVVAAREKLAKMACILHPSEKKYWRIWANELAGLEDGLYRQKIDEVNELMEIVPKHRLKQEMNTPFHSVCVGKREIDTLVKECITPTKKKKNKFSENGKEILRQIWDKKTDVHDVANHLVEKMPELTYDDRQACGALLCERLKKEELPDEPIQIAKLYLSAAMIANENKKCFDQARGFILENVAVTEDMQEMMTVIKTMRENLEDNSYFRRGIDKFIASENKKSPKKGQVKTLN